MRTVTHIYLGLELRGRFHRTWGDDDLTAFHLFTFDATEESTHIVAGLALKGVECKPIGNSMNTHPVQLLMEHLWSRSAVNLGNDFDCPHRCQ